MKNKTLISSQIEEVKSNGSIRTKKPSIVSVAINHRFAIEAQGLFLDIKSGIEREHGLVRLELYAVYEGGEEELGERKSEK